MLDRQLVQLRDDPQADLQLLRVDAVAHRPER
jgi:hypothetical protein